MKIDFLRNVISFIDEFGVIKKHSPLSTSFYEVEILADGRVLVCEAPFNFEYRAKSNLYCLSRTLDVEWFLSVPNLCFEDDLYVGFTSWGNEIYANSLACYRVGIDTNSGLLKSVEFTK
ncbi:hypothetical protein GWR56_08325 [Mucilaginibacter sp. 14171R-50]|uniref:hypothetical protein n=1 Tax=Mucilaginibacter sp. 14171R-50 TaxID=2703789 RepID=UPI00138D0C4F|nr:hypothetical protein [Mucilaginibacter sp. 14171R-50]QHS55546.1 hypothetical protein GWR56_08325 [Mucilaginibacter sp. 14171R-50]